MNTEVKIEARRKYKFNFNKKCLHSNINELIHLDQNLNSKKKAHRKAIAVNLFGLRCKASNTSDCAIKCYVVFNIYIIECVRKDT